MSSMSLRAKMEMLKEMRKKMRSDDVNDLGSKLGGKFKKVTVAAPDEEGLQKGLSMAEKILQKKKELKGEDDFSPEDMMSDMAEEDNSEEMEDEESEESSEEKECPMCGEKNGKCFACGGMKGK